MADRLTVLTFATAHVTAVSIATVLLFHTLGTLGSVFEPFGTTTGVSIFLVLWCITLYTHHRGFETIDPWKVTDSESAGHYLLSGLGWGALTGMGFFWVVFGSFLLVTVASNPSSLGDLLSTPTILLSLFATIGSLTIGGMLGLLASTVDVCLVSALQRLQPSH